MKTKLLFAIIIIGINNLKATSTDDFEPELEDLSVLEEDAEFIERQNTMHMQEFRFLLPPKERGGVEREFRNDSQLKSPINASPNSDILTSPLQPLLLVTDTNGAVNVIENTNVHHLRYIALIVLCIILVFVLCYI